MFYASLHATLSSKTATESRGLNVGNKSIKNQHLWHHSVHKKHYSLYVKFDVRFVISFMRKSKVNKKGHFSWGMVHAFFQKVGLEKNCAAF
jgi:hypothetical protein